MRRDSERAHRQLKEREKKKQETIGKITREKIKF
jgi:hypothetical protein